MAADDSLAFITGPQILGVMFNWCLLGVLIVQCYLYYLCFPTDTLALKCFAYGTVIYEIVQTGLITADIFHGFVYNFGNINAVTAFYNSWFSVPIMCGCLSAAVQCFFAWRIWILSRLQIVVVPIVLVALTQMSTAIVGGVKLKNIVTAEDEAKTTPFIDTWLAGSAIADVTIAVSMTILLVRAKTGYKQSDAIINRLITLVLETGTLTATIAVIDLALFTALPQTLLHECPVQTLSKLYSNTLLINFNSRALRGRGPPGASTTNFHSYVTSSFTAAKGDSGQGEIATNTSFRLGIRDNVESSIPLEDRSITKGHMTITRTVSICDDGSQDAKAPRDIEYSAGL